MEMGSVHSFKGDLAASQLPKPTNDPVFSQAERTTDPEKISGETERREGVTETTSSYVLHSPSPKWNDPHINVWRTWTCFLGFLIMGANDAAFGVRTVIPF